MCSSTPPQQHRRTKTRSVCRAVISPRPGTPPVRPRPGTMTGADRHPKGTEPTMTKQQTKLLTDLTYGAGAAGPLKLDLYTTESSQPAPVLIYLHGGAWITGRRDETPERLHNLAAQGIAVASIDYDFVQDAPFPAQLNNIKDALAWAQDNAAEHNL